MDRRKMGAFIAGLRQERGWTQETLGERLGVSNKTVSRWETGNYMPSIEMLSLMAREFGVSLNELVSGQRLTDESFREAADRNLADAAAERKRFPRLCRWLRTHRGGLAAALLLCAVIAALAGYIYRYGQAHPADAVLPGTFCFDKAAPGQEYLAFDMDGTTFYRYRPFEPLERGLYRVDGELVTVVTAERTYQLLLKGEWLYETDPDSGLMKKHRFCGQTGEFINVRVEDFDSLPMPDS